MAEPPDLTPLLCDLHTNRRGDRLLLLRNQRQHPVLCVFQTPAPSLGNPGVALPGHPARDGEATDLTPTLAPALPRALGRPEGGAAGESAPVPWEEKEGSRTSGL